MADTDALESLAELLPPNRRERFFAIASKFRDLPEDDDHLQMLEAVGFIMLVMKEVPGEIAEMLRTARGGMDEAMAAQLRSEFVEVLTQSLDTPSYKDLREAMLSIRDHENRFRLKVETMLKRLSESDRCHKQRTRIAPSLIGGLTGGLVAATIVIPLILFGTPLVMPQKQTPLPKKLEPYAALHQRGQLNYTEVNHLHHGKVGMFLIGGEVVDTFQEAGHGVIVIKLGK
ncbi:MAG: hypothetical protein O3C21_00250 [Verrucomicrobia bacterium]|nr:hypothetical protein [Verrucomicrobiota bacterium]